jgi:hypothetical protein
MKKFLCGALTLLLLGGAFPQFSPVVFAADENVAEGKVATASSENPEYPAANGVDGVTNDLENRFQAGSRQYPQWYKVDLGALYNISGLQIYWARRIIAYKYTLEVSDDDVTYMLMKDDRYRSEANADNQSVSERVTLKTSGRYVKLTCYGCFNGISPEGDFAFKELLVMGSDAIVGRNPVNAAPKATPGPTPIPKPGEIYDVAAGKTATADSFKEEYPPEEAVALASTGGRFEAGSRQYPHWFKVDLGEICNIESAEIQWFRRGLTYKYRLEVSDDDAEYTLVRDEKYRTEGNAVDLPYEKFDLVTSGRYVRITCFGCYWEGDPQGDFAFYRFTLKGTPAGTSSRRPVNKIEPSAAPTPPPHAPGEPYNAAYKKTATASNTNPSYPLENGVDEDADSRWQAGNRQYPHWYKVDLGEIFDISQIEIAWFRKDLTYRYLIEASTDDKRWVTIRDERARGEVNVGTARAESIALETRGRYVKLSCYACLYGDTPQGDFAFNEFRVIGVESANQDPDFMPGAGGAGRALTAEVNLSGGAASLELTVNRKGDGFSGIPKALTALVVGRDNGGDIQDIQRLDVDLNQVAEDEQTLPFAFTPKGGLSYTAAIWDGDAKIYK